ncbi:MAG TPA: glycosyl transferase, partial [Rhodospirillales bacterium]|nr:glycosyl transferase [Rhodospirillales bacterium]
MLRDHPRRIFGRRRAPSPWDDQKPIRHELFSVERLEEHARSLAAAQPVTPKPTRGHPLAGRLADNAAVLLESHRIIAEATDKGRAITPAAEWLLDNYHLVEKQIHDIRFDLPPGYYRQLPKLADGPLAGYPRVLGVTWAFVAHTDSRFDPAMLCRYVAAYQQVQPLTIGELWALAITLRIVLIENLRRFAQNIVRNRASRQEANRLADRLLGVGGTAEPAPVVFAEHERAPLTDVFAVQLVYRLRDQDPRVTPALAWLDQRLLAQGTTADAVVREVHQRQGAASVTVRNIITSMRMISDVDWTELVESVSLVDDALAAGGSFTEMDFPTRNLYRSAIEELARGSARTEIDIAQRAVAAANSVVAGSLGQTPPEGTDGRRNDPGYFLLAGGRRGFEALIGFHPPLRAWPGRLNRAFGVGGYALAIALVTAVLVALPLLALAATGLGAAWLSLLGVLGAIPAVDVAVALVNRAAVSGFGARLLPAMELRDGIPADLRTLVAVPTLLTTPAAIEEQVERLEVHHLASPEGDLQFAMLSDWVDATTEHADGDTSLLAAAREGIARL